MNLLTATMIIGEVPIILVSLTSTSDICRICSMVQKQCKLKVLFDNENHFQWITEKNIIYLDINKCF